MRVDAVVYFRVSDPTMSVVKVENFFNSTYLLAQTTLRSVLGTRKLSELLSERESISDEMQVRGGGRKGGIHDGFCSGFFQQSQLDEATDPWGVKVERVEV